MDTMVTNRNKVFLSKEDFKNINIPHGFERLTTIFNPSCESPVFNPRNISPLYYRKTAIFDILFRTTRDDGILDEQRLCDIMTDSYGIREAHQQELSALLHSLRNHRKYKKFQKNYKRIAERYLSMGKNEEFHRLASEINGPNHRDIKDKGVILTPQEFAKLASGRCPIEILPTSKVMVACAGKGTDLDAVIKKLMADFQNLYADEGERRQHIIQHVVYACEIDPHNAQILRQKWDGLRVTESCIKDIINDADLRQRELGVVEFDAFICHPPFEERQKTRVASGDDYRRRGGNSFCWKMLKALRDSNILKRGGYIALLIPMGWCEYAEGRDKATGLYTWMTREMTPIRIENVGKEESAKMFSDDVRLGGFDMYCAVNTPCPDGHLTEFRSSSGVEHMFDLKRRNFLPNSNFERAWAMTTTHEDHQLGKDRVIGPSNYDTRRKHLHQYRVTPEGQHQRPFIRTLSNRDHERELMYTDVVKRGHDYIHDDRNMSKIIIRRFGGLHVLADWDNQYLLGQSVFAITFRRSERREMERALAWLQRPDVKTLFEKDLMWSTADPNIRWKFFRIMRKNFYD